MSQDRSQNAAFHAGRWTPSPGAGLARRPCSALLWSALEALESLLSTAGHWQGFAHLGMQGAWELFSSTHTNPQGVGLLARQGLGQRRGGGLTCPGGWAHGPH